MISKIFVLFHRFYNYFYCFSLHLVSKLLSQKTQYDSVVQCAFNRMASVEINFQIVNISERICVK